MPACPACGIDNPPDYTFCDNCGAALAVPAPPSYAGMTSVPPAAALTCPTCGSPLIAGATFCDQCGAPLGGAAWALPTQGSGVPEPPPLTPLGPIPTQGGGAPAPPITPPVGPLPRVRLVAQFNNIDIALPGKAEVIIGRDDPAVDVDLTAYEGLVMGISRRHARVHIQGGQVLIEDLNSTNHTAVNQQQLLPNQRQPLHDGDEVRFGRMILTVRIG